MPYRFRHAVCNELFEQRPFEDVCRAIRRIGYDGIEIAPFTLGEKPSDISVEARRRTRRIIADEGLVFVGLHWLMVSPAGLHVTTPDRALRERSWAHIRGLIGLCADLGANGVMVFGSPKQRATTAGLSPTVRTMFDSHNAVDETEPHAALIDHYCDYIRHIHVNETDGRHPGTGDY